MVPKSITFVMATIHLRYDDAALRRPSAKTDPVALGVENASRKSPSVLDGYITEAELARQLNCSVRTVQRLAERDYGPPRTRVGRSIYYHCGHFREWLLKQEENREPVDDVRLRKRRQLRRRSADG